ncbi:hypothetical protein D3C80_1458910 [compost metagenome]
MGCDGASGNVEDEWRQLPGQLIQRRDHQQQSLGRGEGGGKCAGLQRAVHGSNSSAFGLHLDHVGYVAPNVFPAVTGPGSGLFRHGRTRGNWVNGNHFTGAISHGSDSVITICSNHLQYLSVLTKLQKSASYNHQ